MRLLDNLNNYFLASSILINESIHDFKRDQKGVTAVEYAIVIAGVAAVVSVIFAKDTGTVAKLLSKIFAEVETSVTTNMASGTGG